MLSLHIHLIKHSVIARLCFCITLITVNDLGLGFQIWKIVNFHPRLYLTTSLFSSPGFVCHVDVSIVSLTSVDIRLYNLAFGCVSVAAVLFLAPCNGPLPVVLPEMSTTLLYIYVADIKGGNRRNNSTLRLYHLLT